MSWLTQLLSGFAKPFKWWVVVAPWERGVRVRLGKTATELTPGPHWRIPFLDRIYVQSIRLRTIYETNQTVSTADHKVVTVSFAVQLVVADIIKLYNAVYNPEVTLATLVMGEVARVIAATSSTEITPVLLTERVNAMLPTIANWGLAELRFELVGFAFVRTYRILNTDYRIGAGLYNLDKDDHGER